jgi:murein DD-endopeptidase MepM/ murein hydrolase activator NlpD
MKPGSPSSFVHVGQHVKAGQQIGDLGNSGNSGAPHLHFQVMDKPSFLSAQGLPYEFAQFELAARGEGDASVDAALDGDVVPFQSGFRPEWMHCRLPLYTDLIDFPPARGDKWEKRPHHGPGHSPVHGKPQVVTGK